MDLRLDSSDALLLVVDVQERLVAALEEETGQELVKNVVNLVHAARHLAVPVLTTEQYPKGLGPTVPEVMAALKEAAAPAPLAKDCFSAVLHPEVLPTLNRSGRRRVLVVGIEAHVCVYLTARDLVAEGFITHVAHDACASRRVMDHATALSLLKQVGACVTTTETVIFDWLRSSAHPAFKDMSRRVK